MIDKSREPRKSDGILPKRAVKADDRSTSWKTEAGKPDRFKPVLHLPLKPDDDDRGTER